MSKPVKDQLPVVIRPYTVTDINFIMSSWLKSHKEDLDFSTRIDNLQQIKKALGRLRVPKLKTYVPNNKYYNIAPTMFKAILAKAGALVACDANDYDHIYGYMVAETIHDEPVVHWVYVKNIFRRTGIGKLLLSKVCEPDSKPLTTFITARALEIYPTIPFIFDESLLGKLVTTPGTPCAPLIDVPAEEPQTQEDIERIRHSPGTKDPTTYTKQEIRVMGGR